MTSRIKRLLLTLALLAFALPASAGADTVSFVGPSITIPDVQGPASPYPSTIPVSNLQGAITATAGVRGVQHSFPEDLDVLLVGPGGQNVVLLSDSCRTGEQWINVDLEFDDAAATQAPESFSGGLSEEPEFCADGYRYKPTNYGAGDPFPPPAPPGPHGSVLAVFNGTSPVGTWSLFVVDDAAGEGGRMEGWSLTLSGVRSGLKCGGKTATVVGTPGRDSIEGTKRADVIVALGGNDNVQGRGGPDRICGGKGNDKLFGGNGNDRLFGAGGNDLLVGGRGKDLLRGGKGRDKERQ